MVKVESRIEKRAAGATKLSKADAKGKILEVAWWLKGEGFSERTIRNYAVFLRLLVKSGADLNDAQNVKAVIARQDTWSLGSKSMAVRAYSQFAAKNDITWQKPRYKPVQKLPFIPLESEIDALIAGCGPRTSTIIQLIKETGLRIGEVLRLKWIDLDTERNIITINEPEKLGNARQFKISNKLVARLNQLPKKRDNIFAGTSTTSARRNLQRQRRKLALKLNNPRLLQIKQHTIRHWKATMEYHKTKDPWHVKTLLGHRSLRSTELYIHIEETLFQDQDNQGFHSATAKTIEQAQKLIQTGFEYVCTHNDIMLFRKRK